MFIKDDLIYFVDVDNGHTVQGYVDSDDNGKCEKLLIRFDDNHTFKVNVDRILIAKTETEAFTQFEDWKQEYKKLLLQDNKWINDLVESWVAHECDYGLKECQSIMKEIISNKLGTEIE